MHKTDLSGLTSRTGTVERVWLIQIQAAPEDVDKIVEAILTTWREVTEKPGVVAEWRAKYKLLPDLPQASGPEPMAREFVAATGIDADHGHAVAPRGLTLLTPGISLRSRCASIDCS